MATSGEYNDTTPAFSRISEGLFFMTFPSTFSVEDLPHLGDGIEGPGRDEDDGGIR